MEQTKLLEVLHSIPVAELSREDWLKVGMALKAEGLSMTDWDTWSQNDSRYHKGECNRLWNGFNGTGVTGASITMLAKDYGYEFANGDVIFDWDSEIQYDGTDGYAEYNNIGSVSTKEQLIEYISTLFKPEEFVAFTLNAMQDEDGKWKPASAGSYAKTAGKIIEDLNHYDDLTDTLGDINEQSGGWIRFNPFDGKGVKNDNVTSYRYALVESDSMSIADQEAMYRKLNLPIAIMVHSGGKSVHAIVRIEADSLEEYRSRVNILYNYLEENGVHVDTQNRNPSRLSRMPGLKRGDAMQYIMAKNIGAKSWREWCDSINGVHNELPDLLELTSDIIGHPPEMSKEIIKGVLRKGHKMLIAGESKAGKSFLLMELAIALANGGDWLGRKCEKCKVLYVNLEIDSNSCTNRFSAIYRHLGITTPDGMPFVWNLRGKSMPLNELVPPLLKAIAGKGFDVVIVDPIYKVLMGDENNASDMAAFCNQFDRIAEAGNVTVIYCHHFSKGQQGNKKSIDRSSGSGVFGRDPDAIMTITALDVSEEIKNQYFGANTSAWRVEYSLREFASPKPANLFFDYPTHHFDKDGALDDCNIEGSVSSQLAKSPRRMSDSERLDLINQGYYRAKQASGVNRVTISEIAHQIGKDSDNKTVKNWVLKFPDFYRYDGKHVIQIEKTWEDMDEDEDEND